jgi:cell division transport system permease protein
MPAVTLGQAIQVRLTRSSSIVPRGSVAGRALTIVVAIMTFLACLTLGAVSLVQATANTWQSQISNQATIQIQPVDGTDMDARLKQASQIAAGFPGVTSTGIVDDAATKRLLEPWLGKDLDLGELPVPRLIVLSVDGRSPPDFAALQKKLSEKVAGASLDDHRKWVDRLVSMSRSTVIIGMIVLALVLAATVLTVVFATRGAMAGNGDIIEVLHFVGAENLFVARQFERHFLLTAFKGALLGGFVAVLVFIAVAWWSARNLATPGADQATALFGRFAIGMEGYFGVAVIVVAVSLLTMLTTRITVLSYLREIATQESGRG